jgi:hypothetical protein
MQLNMPGMIMFLGKRGTEVLGAFLVLKHGQIASGHLSAYSCEGYQIRASYGIQWKALVYAREQGIKYFHLGGASGIKENPADGLASFKRNWSNDRRLAYFCGRVFDREKYKSLCLQYVTENIEYFPGYRAGEFGFESPDRIDGLIKSRQNDDFIKRPGGP